MFTTTPLPNQIIPQQRPPVVVVVVVVVCHGVMFSSMRQSVVWVRVGEF
jgi:hypothetical protein